MTDEGHRIHYSTDYLRSVASEEARGYLVECGIPRVDSFIEEGPSGAQQNGSYPGFLLLGYVGDPRGAFYIEGASGAVYYLIAERSFFVNSSPRQFVSSLEAYIAVTYGDLAGQDELVEEHLRAQLFVIDPAAIEDSDSFWNDTLGDVSMGVYGDESE
jgi:hypothetical protein